MIPGETLLMLSVCSESAVMILTPQTIKVCCHACTYRYLAPMIPNGAVGMIS